MFVAKRVPDGHRVISISPEWDGAVEKLRLLAADGELVCEGCEQLLWLRAGRIRSRHFAHRARTDCPLDNKSLDVRCAQFQLYRWLEERLPGRVDLDSAMDAGGSPSIADLRIKLDSDKQLLIWIFDRQVRNRHQFLRWKAMQGFVTQFVHTASAMRFHADDFLLLTPSLRDFVQESEYDRCLVTGGRGHVHFFDHETGEVSVFRGLQCVHEPNLFEWHTRRVFSLSEAILDEEIGEIVSEVDTEVVQAWRAERAVQAQAEVRATPQSHWSRAQSLDRRAGRGTFLEQGPISWLDGPLRCEDCGEMTTDWSSVTPAAGTCVCRKCVAIRHQNAGR